MNQLKKIYLACAYSHPDDQVKEERYEKVTKLAGLLLSKGFYVYSPITHGHAISKLYPLPTGWSFWRAYDFCFIDWADALIILDSEDIEKSVGVNSEIGYAAGKGKRIFIVNENADILAELTFDDQTRANNRT